jgi:cysteine-rich repeat protein
VGIKRKLIFAIAFLIFLFASIIPIDPFARIGFSNVVQAQSVSYCASIIKRKSLLFCEDWDSSVPTNGFPNMPGVSWHGWQTATYNEGQGYSELSTQIYHSAPRSLYQLKRANENFVHDQIIRFKPVKEIRVQFYVYFDNTFRNYNKQPVHLIFLQSALSGRGVRMDLREYVNKTGSPVDDLVYAWPPTCITAQGGFFAIASPSGKSHTFKGITRGDKADCFNIRDNLNRWIKVEWAYKINDVNDGRVSLWVDGVPLMVDELLPPDPLYMKIDNLRISGYMSSLESFPTGFYIDDIIVTDDYDVPIDSLVPATCGNSIVEPGEQCDDGNTTPGDGCSATCQLEKNQKSPDFDGNGRVDILDLVNLLQNWGTTDPQTNLDGKGKVDIFDLLLLLQQWGTSAGLPDISFSASSYAVKKGQPVTLTWSVTNASSCNASDDWSGTKPLSGSETLTPSQTSTYTLKCSNTNKTSSKSITVAVTSNTGKLPAFPGAEGFGSDTPGGRGGKVIFVTNLNDSGPGSLRAALEASGPRFVVFKTGGVLKTNKELVIKNPYITIAGQTAPGDGFMIRGTSLRITTHDVVVRGLYIRPGDDPNGPDPENRDAISIANNNSVVYNVILDHNSLSWSTDETVSTWYVTHNITIQWNIISEGLRYSIHPKTLSRHQDHSTGLLIGKSSYDVSIHHNLFAHNLRRNPRINYTSAGEVINNVVYDYKYGTNFGGEGNVIGNIYKPGPSTPSGMKGVYLSTWESVKGPIYVKDNIGPGRETNSGDDWLIVGGRTDKKYQSLTPVFPLSGVVIDKVEEVFDKVLSGSGARPWNRDPVDKRIINDVRNGTGHFIDSQDEVGGWPELDPGTPPQDTDNDGMPDDWEISHGLDPNDPSDNNKDRDGDGYTNIEEWSFSFFD